MALHGTTGALDVVAVEHSSAVFGHTHQQPPPCRVVYGSSYGPMMLQHISHLSPVDPEDITGVVHPQIQRRTPKTEQHKSSCSGSDNSADILTELSSGESLKHTRKINLYVNTRPWCSISHAFPEWCGFQASVWDISTPRHQIRKTKKTRVRNFTLWVEDKTCAPVCFCHVVFPLSEKLENVDLRQW